VSFDGYHDRETAFARVWRAGQTDRVNSASKRTNWIFIVSNFECGYLGLFKLNETAQSVLALTKFVSFFNFSVNFLSISWRRNFESPAAFSPEFVLLRVRYSMWHG